MNNTTTVISNVMWNGSTVTGMVPLSALPTLGLTPSNYLVNIWPRSGQGGLEVISDFAPDNSDFRVSATPEPATWSLLALSAAAGHVTLPEPAKSEGLNLGVLAR